MSGWLRYLALNAQARTGFGPQIVVWSLIAVVASTAAMVFLCIAAFIWLADRYDAVTAGLVPFSIDGISREAGPVATESLRRWTVNLNWPRGLLAFRASGFTQRLRAPLRVSGEQCLEAAERKRLEES